MANAWQKSTDKLLAIGNVAATVDRIFSSLTNLQLRLENATERLTNAQDRLADTGKDVARANRDLERAQRRLVAAERERFSNYDEYESALLGLESAQERVEDSKTAQERATRSLTIAENGLARAQNQVLGTYIQVGIQSVGLLQSLPLLIGQFGGLAAVLGTIAGIGAIAVAATFLLDKSTMDEAKQQFSEVTGAWTDLKNAFKEDMGPIIRDVIIPWLDILAKALEAIIVSLRAVIDMISTMGEVFGGGIRKTGSKIKSNWQSVLSGNFTSITDGIVKPDGTIIRTDPKDTLVAMKDIDSSVRGMGGGGGGVSVVITGPIYGVNAQDISRALLRELSRKVTI